MLATFCCVEDLPVARWRRAAVDVGELRRVPGRHRHRPRPEHDAAGRPQPAAARARWARPPGTARPRRTRSPHDAAPAARRRMEAGAWGWSTTNSPTHAGPNGEPVPTRLAANEERVALGRTIGEFNRGIIEILPPSITAARRGRSPAPDRRRPGQRPPGLLPRLRRATRAATWRTATRRGRAALRAAARDPVQPALHAEEDDVLQQPRRVGRASWPSPSRSGWPRWPIPTSGPSCARPPCSASAGGPACPAGSSRGTRSSSARSRWPRTARSKAASRSRSWPRSRASTSPTSCSTWPLEERLETEFQLARARPRKTSRWPSTCRAATRCPRSRTPAPT